MDEKSLYDVIVIGGGPAGLTASLYLARAKYRVLVIEVEHFGGQITITDEVVNYPGVKRTDGKTLTETMRHQAEDFGAEFLLSKVISLDLESDVKIVHTERGAFHCFGVLLATGAHPRAIGFTGEQEFRGRGVAYCATCDGEFFTGKDVFVIGGGFAAAEESVFLTRYAKKVTILIRGEDFSCAESASEGARNNPKIEIIPNTEIVSVSGDGALDTLVYRNRKNGKETTYHSKEGFGVFVFAGYEPETSLVKDLGILDELGYVITDRAQSTGIDGLYAAGDVCQKSLRQVVTAVGDGALAATELEHYAAKLQEKTGFHPKRPEPIQQKTTKTTAGQSITQGKRKWVSEEMLPQLNAVFARMGNPLILKLSLDEREISTQLAECMNELASLSDMLTVESGEPMADFAPYVSVCRADGEETGLVFHGVPGGHEFTSFVLGLYNASGTGQPIDEAILGRIIGLKKECNIQVLVSLSCTMCPDLVVAVQRIAALNPIITAHIYDINHFEELKNRYQVMSVPCMVINEESISFGKKNITQILDLLEA